MNTEPRYSYAPLSSTRHTRLVVLHPSETDNYPILCELVEVDIDEGPAYEALSYTWNNEAPSEPLEIISADSSGPRSLLITPNCARALRLLRKRIGKRPTAQTGLWVDAICINQSHNEEKSAQVSMMAEIYKRARTVVVWLGEPHAPASRRSMLPLHLSRPFSSDLHFTWSKTWYPRWIQWLFSTMEPVAEKMLEKGRTQLRPLVAASYWTRAWTLQEYPHSTTRLLCLNSEYASILGLHSAANVIHVQHRRAVHLHRTLFEMNRRRRSIREDPLNHRPRLAADDTMLLSRNLTAVTRNLKCSEPRDKVFALRQLFPQVFGSIAVDYNRSVEDIFTEATRCLITESRSLYALYTSCLCRELYNGLNPREESYDIPSWAIDWTGEHLREESSWSALLVSAYAFPPKRDQPMSFSEDGLRLNLSGKCLSRVSTCVSDKIVYHPDTGVGAKVLVSVVRKFLIEGTEKQFITSAATLGSAMAKLLYLLCRSDSKEVRNAESQMEVESDVDRICDLMGEGATTYGEIMRWRRLFVTTDGKIGVGNSDVVPGDLICNFAGLYMPFVVREKGAYHELISPAIVVGAMREWPGYGGICKWWEDEEDMVPWEIV